MYLDSPHVSIPCSSLGVSFGLLRFLFLLVLSNKFLVHGFEPVFHSRFITPDGSLQLGGKISLEPFAIDLNTCSPCIGGFHATDTNKYG